MTADCRCIQYPQTNKENNGSCVQLILTKIYTIFDKRILYLVTNILLILMLLILLGCLPLHCLEYLDVQEHESVKQKNVFLKGTPVL